MIRYVLQDRRDNRIALFLLLFFIAFYVVLNYPYLAFMSDHADLVQPRSPFYGVKFGLNLFNFDPSMYYGYDNATIIHPYKNLLSGPLGSMANSGPGNALFLGVQSLLNAGGTALLFYLFRRAGNGRAASILIACLFGFSSYAIFTALVPDSYPYAQFGLIVSMLVLQHYREREKLPTWPMAWLGLINFGVTATNLIPFAGAVVVQKWGEPLRKTARSLLLMVGAFLLLAAGFCVVQLLLPGGTAWVSRFWSGLENGGFSYVALFSWEHHWKAIYMLGIHPLLTPDVALISEGIVAVATNLASPLPLHVLLTGAFFLISALAGFIRGIRTKEAWTAILFPAFAIGLHLVVGYGLATFSYDLYLYAGHYWFALFLLVAILARSIGRPVLQKAFLGLLTAAVLVTAAHNVLQHAAVLEFIGTVY